MRSRVVPIVRKEFREIRRDPVTLAFAVLLPIIMLFLFGYAVSYDVDDVPLAVLDLDRSAASSSLVDAFVNTGDFVVRARPRDQREVRRLMDAGTVRVALVIPRGFGLDLLAGRNAQVQTLVDGTHASTALIIRNEAEAVTTAFALGQAVGSVGPSGPALHAPAEPRVWYNPALRSATFVVPGLFAVILMGFPPLLTVLAVVREKESGSVQQIYASPVRAWEFVAGKMIPYIIIAYAELVSILVLGAWWFELPFRGSPALLALASTLYVFCTVGIGLLVSTVTRSQVVAMLLAIVITFMPAFLFSGFIFPISSMPEAMQWYTRLFPARYFTEASRGLFLRGTGWGQLLDELVILAAYTGVVFGTAAFRFRKKVA